MRHVPDKEPQHQYRKCAWNCREPEDCSERRVPFVQHAERDERSHYGAGIVSSRVKSERAPANGWIDGFGDQCIAWRRAYSLANAIGDPNSQHLCRGMRRCREWSYHRCDHVAGEHQPLARLNAVRPPAARQLQQRRNRFRSALDDAYEARARAKHRSEKYRQQRIHHFRRDIGEEAHRTERQYVAPELLSLRHQSGPLMSGTTRGEQLLSP
jgi:hypothetical protein